MRRLMSLALVAGGLVMGAGCCHTCDVCDDCGGCAPDYGVYSQPTCTSCGGYAGKTIKPMKPSLTQAVTTQVATPARTTAKTR